MSMSAPSSWLFSSDTSRYSTRARLLFMGLSFAIGILTFLLYLAIWYLCTTNRRRRFRGHQPADDDDGMSADAIAALPAFAGPAQDCAVCLGQVEAGEKARRLPKCGHEFHADCVDAWLRKHSTCPMCRAAADVVGPSAAAAAAANKKLADAAAAAAEAAVPPPV